MKQIFTHTFFPKKAIRFLLMLLILLVAMPIIQTKKAEAQTTKTGNFFTKRFKRKNRFKRKSKNSTAFQRKPFKCSEVGKTKVEQIKVSKKQLRRWEEERLVKAEQEKMKQRQTKNYDTKQSVILSASSKNDIQEISSQTKMNIIQENIEIEPSKAQKKEDKNTEKGGWYSSQKHNLPKIAPILINKKNQIATQKNKQELEIAAKHARLGYTIILESNNENQLQIIKKHLISIGTEEKSIKIKSSQNENQNEVNLKIEK